MQQEATGSTPRGVSPEPSPPESRASPSFSFHEERRMLKSDEYWLSHKLPRLPPPAQESEADEEIDEEISPRTARSLIFEDADDDPGRAAGDGLHVPRHERPSTMIGGHGAGWEYDPSVSEMDPDERLALAEEESEKRLLEAQTPTGMPDEPKFDTGKSKDIMTSVLILVKAFAESGVGSELEAL